jgi:uncharacterized protein (UPF0297 family)
MDSEKNLFKTVQLNTFDKAHTETENTLSQVLSALKEKGYSPIYQIVGYIISGDPTYITNHKNARSLIQKIDRDVLLEEIVSFYLENNKNLNI